MAQITYRANLNAATFPFLAEDFGRSVIVPGQDNNFNRQVTSKEDSDKDIGIPQVYYMHNVMPFAQGLQSVGYKQIVEGVHTGFLDVFALRDDTGVGFNSFMGVSYDGTTSSKILWILSGGIWTSTSTAVPDKKITYAHLQGKTYIYIESVGCLRWDFATSAFASVTMTGLDTSKILGITYAAGYMIAWDSTSIYWSSTLPISGDVVDFAPSIVTGAGSQSLEAARGKITVCLPHQMGFIAYTSQNAIVHTFTSNSLYPFSARDLVSSGGLLDAEVVGFDSASSSHYAYTTSGLQSISVSATTVVFPEVTDFISGRRFEDYNASSYSFVQYDLAVAMKKRLTVVASRYLVISYGMQSLTHALVYDMALKRWGKLKIAHVSCFEYEVPNELVSDIPKQSIAFLQDSGNVYTVDFASASAATDSCLILGKYQYVRSRTLQLDEVVLENVRKNNAFELTDLISLGGKDFYPASGYLSEIGEQARKYLFRSVGVNHSLQFSRSFRLVSLLLVFNIHGKR